MLLPKLCSQQMLSPAGWLADRVCADEQACSSLLGPGPSGHRTCLILTTSWAWYALCLYVCATQLKIAPACALAMQDFKNLSDIQIAADYWQDHTKSVPRDYRNKVGYWVVQALLACGAWGLSRCSVCAGQADVLLHAS